jgi:hypothetical protein
MPLTKQAVAMAVAAGRRSSQTGGCAFPNHLERPYDSWDDSRDVRSTNRKFTGVSGRRDIGTGVPIFASANL